MKIKNKLLVVVKKTFPDAKWSRRGDVLINFHSLIGFVKIQEGHSLKLIYYNNKDFPIRDSDLSKVANKFQLLEKMLREEVVLKEPNKIPFDYSGKYRLLKVYDNTRKAFVSQENSQIYPAYREKYNQLKIGKGIGILIKKAS